MNETRFCSKFFFRKNPLNVYENTSSMSQVVPCGQTDRPDEVAFRNFASAPVRWERYLSKIRPYYDQISNSDMWLWYNEPTAETSWQTHQNRGITCLKFTTPFFFVAQQPRVDQGRLIIEASRTVRSTSLVRTPLDEWSDRCRDLYLITHDSHKRHPFLRGGFEPALLPSERPQTYTLDREDTGIGLHNIYAHKYL